MTPLIIGTLPAEPVVIPGWPLMPATGEGFADMLALCTDPVATPPPAEETPAPIHSAKPESPAAPDRLLIMENDAAAIVLPMTSPRDLRLDDIHVEADPAHADTGEHSLPEDRPVVSEPVSAMRVPPEILGLAVTFPLPAPAPEIRPAHGPESSGKSPKGVTNFPLHYPETGMKATPAPASAVAPAAVAPTPVVPASEASAALVHRTSSDSQPPRMEAVMTPAAPLFRPDAGARFISAEKSAVHVMRIPGDAAPVSRDQPVDKFLTIDEQHDVTSDKSHGIGRAKSPADMQAMPEPIPEPMPFAPSRAGMINADSVPVAGQSFASPIVTAGTVAAGAAAVTGRHEISLPVTDAGAVVREVAELTHDFRMRERSSVEVKFNFQDETELSVRLAYRDGDVHTTFRTDSEELRVALGREWQGYAANIAQEPRGYRMADPVFTASNNFSDSSLGRDSGSAAGDDARNRQPLPDPDQPAAPRSASRDHGFRPSAPASAGHRLSSDRLLHAFA